MPFVTSGGHNPSRRSAQSAIEGIQLSRSGQRFQVPPERTAQAGVARERQRAFNTRQEMSAAIQNRSAQVGLARYNEKTLMARAQTSAGLRESPRHVANRQLNANQRAIQGFYERINQIDNM